MQETDLHRYQDHRANAGDAAGHPILERDFRLSPDMVEQVERRIDQAREEWAEELEV